MWYQLDKEGKISKNSATAETMRKYSCQTLDQFEGKDIDTVEGEGGFLCIKAY